MLVLGISGAFGHDAAACLVAGGQLVAMAEEERFTRVKRAPGALPVNAIRCCLDQAGAESGDVDVLAASWNPRRAPGSALHEYVPRLLGHEQWRGCGAPHVVHVDHHLAHAASSFLTSGLQEAAVLVMDGHGEDVSTSIGVGRGTSVTMVEELPIGESLGHFFEAVSAHVGLGRHDAGKLMGLAAYGAACPQRLVESTETSYRTGMPSMRGTPPNHAFRELMQLWHARLCSYSAPFRATGCRTIDGFSPEQLTLAATAQCDLSAAVTAMGRHAVDVSGVPNLAIAGGVALNCGANGVLAGQEWVENLHVPPPAHDPGGALGAALLVAGVRLEHPITPYLGPEVDDPTALEALRNSGVDVRTIADPVEVAAGIVARGGVVAWFQGRAEIGPRALGARSLIASPGTAAMRDRVNLIKGRELWRPLAPSMTSAAARLFCPDAVGSGYMLRAAALTPAGLDRIPAVAHVDGSSRPQLVDVHGQPDFHRLVETVGRLTGTGVVLNTSLNGPGEPIVNSAADAARFLMGTATDALVIGHLLATKGRVA